MPNETLTFNAKNYPDMKGVKPGSSVKLTVEGKVTANDGAQIQITTDNVAMQTNGAEQEMNSMMGDRASGSKPAPVSDTEEDY